MSVCVYSCYYLTLYKTNNYIEVSEQCTGVGGSGGWSLPSFFIYSPEILHIALAYIKLGNEAETLPQNSSQSMSILKIFQGACSWTLLAGHCTKHSARTPLH